MAVAAAIAVHRRVSLSLRPAGEPAGLSYFRRRNRYRVELERRSAIAPRSNRPIPTAISQQTSDPVNAVPPVPGELVPDPPRTLVEGLTVEVTDAVGRTLSEGVCDPDGLTDPDGETLPEGLTDWEGEALGQSIRAVEPSVEKYTPSPGRPNLIRKNRD